MHASRGTSASPVRLDLELCKACGVCIELCPEKVFDRDKLGQPVVARPDDCSRCLICELHCPDFAIEIRRRDRPPKGNAGGSALTREDLVAASRHAADEHAGCSHDGEEG
jgi:2-oxoglutarate ferredoxin oxidoreductase subunit delta